LGEGVFVPSTPALLYPKISVETSFMAQASRELRPVICYSLAVLRHCLRFAHAGTLGFLGRRSGAEDGQKLRRGHRLLAMASDRKRDMSASHLPPSRRALAASSAFEGSPDCFPTKSYSYRIGVRSLDESLMGLTRSQSCNSSYPSSSSFPGQSLSWLGSSTLAWKQFLPETARTSLRLWSSHADRPPGRRTSSNSPSGFK